MSNVLIVSNLLLWCVVVAMGIAILALLRQVGVLYERVAPAGALMMNNKLRVGDGAPEVAANTLDGATLQIGAEAKDGRSCLLFFVSPDCPVCKTLLPAVLAAAEQERDWLQLVFASDGAEQDHKSFIKRHGLSSFPYVISEVLGINYGVSKLPYGVLIDEKAQIASMGIINSREHLDSLFEAKERKVASIQDYVKQQNEEQLFLGEKGNELAG